MSGFAIIRLFDYYSHVCLTYVGTYNKVYVDCRSITFYLKLKKGVFPKHSLQKAVKI